MTPESTSAKYDRYRRAVHGESLPLALVDLDAVDRNVEQLLAPVRGTGKSLRLASKSLRCVALIRYVMERCGQSARGVMAYAVPEAMALIDAGFDDILVAYPSVQASDCRLIAAANARGSTVAIVVDSDEHLEPLAVAARAHGTVIPVVIEADLSYRRWSGRVHLGVRRSPLHTAHEVVEFARRVATQVGLRVHGVMGYEAQIAGLGDANPFSPWMNTPRRLVREISRSYVERTRREIADGLRREGIAITVFNGGGSGSLNWCATEDALTEVSAGSGFVDSHLFDYYRHLRLEPALCFALQVVRRPRAGMVTCHGGGYVASGEPGQDRLPLPYLPEGLQLTRMEAVGEVQTPLSVPAGLKLFPGDPVFFRHAKAGELAERFSEYLFVRGDRIERRELTYRGAGKCFV